jgi:hypothetical protein
VTIRSPAAVVLAVSWAAVTSALCSVAPSLMLVVLGGAVFLVLAARVPLRYLVVALLVYLPLEPTLLTYLPAALGPVLRYAPEALLDIAVLWRVLPNRARLRRSLRPVALPALGLVVLWESSVIRNATSTGTALIGLRSEFRFVPVAIAVVLSNEAAKDALLYGRAAFGISLFEVGVLLAQALGGEPIRSIFRAHYDLTLGGIQGTSVDSSNVFGTFPDYNSYGSFLVFTGIVIAAAGSVGLRCRPLVVRSALAAITLGILVSGSRESLVALVIGVGAMMYVRADLTRLTFAFAFVMLALVLVVSYGTGGNLSASERANTGIGEVSRLRNLASPSLVSSNPNDPRSNFRLYLLRSNVGLVWHSAPVLGFGIGSVTDPTRVSDGTSPIFRTQAGRRAVLFNYARDGNWGLLLLEAGFGGVLALAFVFVALGRVALRGVGTHWSGLALLGALAATLVLGFFQSVLQLQAPSFVLWLLAGFALKTTVPNGVDER